LHIPIALDAARAGCNLFIEKPLSHDFSGVEELIDLVEQGKLKAVVGYQMRFHPCLMHLRNLVEQRAIGKFLSVRVEVGDYMPAWHSYEDYRNLYASKKDLGGGVVLTQIHELDYLFWLFGMPRSLFALGGHLSRLEMDVEDTADVLMECFVDEQTLPVSMHMDYLQRPSARGCVIVGDQGRAVMDLVSPCVTLLDSSGRLVESVHYDSYDRNQSFLDEVKCFLEYTHGAEQKSLVTLREAVQSLKIALAVKKSLQTNSMINFKYD
jgi:predicted dehydrogenase